MRPAQAIPFEAPWLAIKADGKLHISDKAGYDQWLNQSLGDGERAMVLVLPLVADTPGYHAAAFRYYRSTVLPIVAEDLGESNLEDAHDTLVRQFLPLKAVPAKRGRGFKVQRKSTGMESMDCAEFCDYLDRLITWATHPDGRNLTIPASDRRWKWKRDQAAEEP